MSSLADFHQATASGSCHLSRTGTPVHYQGPTSLLPTCLHTRATVLKIKSLCSRSFCGKKKKLRQIHQQPSEGRSCWVLSTDFVNTDMIHLQLAWGLYSSAQSDLSCHRLIPCILMADSVGPAAQGYSIQHCDSHSQQPLCT